MTDELLSTRAVESDRYRGLLVLYPAAYREGHGAVIRDTLLDASDAHGGRPPLLDLVGIATHAVRVRLRLTPDAAVGRVAAAAAPLAAASAVVMALMNMMFREWRWWTGEHDQYTTFGPFLSIGAIAYLAWILVAVAAATTSGGALRTFRAGAAAASALGLALIPVAAVTGEPRPPLYVLATLALFGTIVVLAPSDPAQSPGLFPWVTVGAALALAIGLVLFSQLHWPEWSLWAPGAYWNQSYFANELPLPALLALLITAVACRRRPRWIAAVAVIGISWLPYCYAMQAWVGGGGWHALQWWAVFLTVAAAVGGIHLFGRNYDIAATRT